MSDMYLLTREELSHLVYEGWVGYASGEFDKIIEKYKAVKYRNADDYHVGESLEIEGVKEVYYRKEGE